MENQNKSFFKRVWNRFKKQTPAPPIDPAPPQSGAEAKPLQDEAPKENPFFDDLGNGSGKHFSDPINFDFDTWVYQNGKSFWEQGQRDGRKGIDPRSFFDYGKVHARGLVEQILRFLNGNKAAIEVQKSFADSKAKFERQKYERIQDTIHMRDRFPNKHSRFRGWFYIVIAIVLIVADIPLSILIVKKGFEMGKETELFNLIHPDIMSLLLALGIAFVATMVKIVYDDFFGGRLSHFATIIEDHQDIDHNNKKDRLRLWASYFGKKIFLLFALGLSVITIFKLGEFRFETMKVEKVASMNAEKEASIKKIRRDYDAITISNKQEIIIKKIEAINNRYQEKENSIDLGKWSFILLTLSFPVIGGICLSMGLHNLENRREFKDKKKDEKKAISDWELANQTVCTLQGKLASLNSSLKYVEKPDFEERLFSYFLAVYEHGYTDGYFYPDEIVGKFSYFDKALRMRNKLVARQVLGSTYQGFPSKEFEDLKKTSK